MSSTTAPVAIEATHVASGQSNPVPFHQMYENVHEYFTKNPLTDRKGKPIEVPVWKFPGPDKVERGIHRLERNVKTAERALRMLPKTKGSRATLAKMQKGMADLKTLRNFVSLYRVYVETDDRREVKVLVPDAEYRAGEVRSGGRVDLAWDTPSAYVLPAG